MGNQFEEAYRIREKQERYSRIAMIKEQQELEEIPLVVFSTSSYPGDVTYCKTHGVELITKPFGMKLLIEIAERLVSRYS